MSVHGKAVICSGSEGNFQICADKLFVRASGFLWNVAKEGSPIVYSSDAQEGSFTDEDGQVFAVRSDGIYRLDAADVNAKAPATVQADEPVKSVAYGDVIHTEDESDYPALLHRLTRVDGHLIFEIKERYLSFVGHVGGVFIFHRWSPKEFFAVGADGREQRLYQADELTHTQCVGNCMLMSVQLADGQARCDVYDLGKRAVVDSYVIDSDSDGFSTPIEINGAWTVLWCDELFLLGPDGLTRVFPGKKVRSYLPAQEGVYVSFEEEPVLYLYDTALSHVRARLLSPAEGFRFALLEAFGDGLACCLFNAERMNGLAYVLYLTEALSGDAVDIECEERLFEFEKRSTGESFTCVITFARTVHYDALVRQALAAVDEAFGYFSERNPETLLFDGHVDVVVDGGALSQEQKRALTEGCNKMAQQYFYRNSPVTGDAFNVSVNFSE
ncbi:hypothetical protein PHLH8_58590 [Pseudomonas sp. Pc102]|uniref:hypothetical protein n=1 Tax=Pseudomonas sp. Pc102 TaxID=2678261 RepID=UPI001BD07171|nr:hypothetical protein [Pseudomonas sp. Pc102]BBP86217.1 hypothetical protein PHLH8_58590 [Pseudomonas sp. Pc102]